MSGAFSQKKGRAAELSKLARKWSTYILFHLDSDVTHSTEFGKMLVKAGVLDVCTHKQGFETDCPKYSSAAFDPVNQHLIFLL